MKAIFYGNYEARDKESNIAPIMDLLPLSVLQDWTLAASDTFMADIGKLLETALTVPEIEGIILNPWHRTLMLDKTLIQIILPESPVVS